MPSKTVKISLPDDLLREVGKFAKEAKFSRSALFREALSHYMATKELCAQWKDQDSIACAMLCAPVFNRIWDNEYDAVYDNYVPQKPAKHKK